MNQTLDELIEKANNLHSRGWRFENYDYKSGWFIKPDAENWMIRTPQGAALPFYEALKKALRLIDYLGGTQ